MPRNYRVRAMRAFLQGPFRLIEAQTCFPHLRIRTVTTETAAGEDWLDVLIKIQVGLRTTTTADKRAQSTGSQNRSDGQLWEFHSQTNTLYCRSVEWRGEIPVCSGCVFTREKLVRRADVLASHEKAPLIFLFGV
jgi:hypothetical protein